MPETGPDIYIYIYTYIYIYIHPRHLGPLCLLVTLWSFVTDATKNGACIDDLPKQEHINKGQWMNMVPEIGNDT